MSITYKITRFELRGEPAVDYVVGFALKNTTNDKNGYVESIVPLVSGQDKSEAEICNVAFSGNYDKIIRASGLLAETATVIGAEFVPPDM